jgi:hypothetical protein
MHNDALNILGRLESENKPTDAELVSAIDDLKSALDAVTSDENLDLEVARDIREALETVAAEQNARAEALEEARAEARKLREGILDSNETPETDDDGDDAPKEDEPAVTEDKVPVAAAPKISVIDRLKRHAAARTHATPVKSIPGVDVAALGPASGFDIDADATIGDLGRLFAQHSKSITARGQSSPLFRITRHYDESRTLGNNVDQNNARLAALFGAGLGSPEAASGGLCGPGDVDHSVGVCSETGRPVRDGLVQVLANRGRLHFAPNVGIGDLDGAVSVWTAAMDESPGDNVKPCPPIVCPDELSCEVDAITRCLTVGNFQAKFSPEVWAANLQVLLATFDRVAEQKAIEEIHAASTEVPTIDQGNVLSNFLISLNTILASDRSIQRNQTGLYTLIADQWLRDMLRNQVIRNQGVENNFEQLQLADARIAGWLSEIGVSPIWTNDGTVRDLDGTHRVPTVPGVLPADAGAYLFPREAFMFLDGGTLDLGTNITDSSLNATNDRQAFAESFEKVCFRGCSSYRFEFLTTTACGCTP